MRRAVPTVPDWAIGCMDREYIILDGGAKDPSIAIWLQTESQFFDMRIRHDRPNFEGRKSLEDFSGDELMQLARQSGDTGICTIENNVATWKGLSDRFGFFSDDVSIFPDDGRLDPKGNVIYEYETAKSSVPYEEAWVQQPDDDGLIAHLTLRDDSNPNEVYAALLVTGRYAGYCEKSTSDNHLSLEAQLKEAAGNLERMRRILDCEASYAISPREGAPYRVRHSNFPFREGTELDVPQMNRQILENNQNLPSKRESASWQVESWSIQS
ncbi:MAG: hypothetical protein IH827_10130 [Myxococcales bacterium]|nr:hypothetical protein [Myxococcales bacterium]